MNGAPDNVYTLDTAQYVYVMNLWPADARQTCSRDQILRSDLIVNGPRRKDALRLRQEGLNAYSSSLTCDMCDNLVSVDRTHSMWLHV